MLTHIFKLIWKKKKANSLIIAEVAIAFLVIFALSALAIRNHNLYQTPLGFNFENMWRLSIANHSGWEAKRDLERVKQVIQSLEQQPEIASVALMRSPAFENWVWSSSYEIDGKLISYMGNRISDNAPETFGMERVQGRWFGPEDDGQNYVPVLVSQRFVDNYFPGENLIGKNIAETGVDNQTERRVIGVFRDFRQLGELSSLRPYMFFRETLADQDSGPISGVEIKLQPGTQVQFEARIQKLLKGIAPEWDVEIRPWEIQRQSQMRETLMPMVVLAIVGGFLLLMVAMGLFGVLWQNVTGRTEEIGLRRALGATAGQIHGQIIAELLLICTLGVLLALLLLVQLPMLGVFAELDWSLFAQSSLVASGFMLLLATLCAYYPGKIATHYAPAQALHYE